MKTLLSLAAALVIGLAGPAAAQEPFLFSYKTARTTMRYLRTPLRSLVNMIPKREIRLNSLKTLGAMAGLTRGK
jgi:hypothetical protein